MPMPKLVSWCFRYGIAAALGATGAVYIQLKDEVKNVAQSVGLEIVGKTSTSVGSSIVAKYTRNNRWHFDCKGEAGRTAILDSEFSTIHNIFSINFGNGTKSYNWSYRNLIGWSGERESLFDQVTGYADAWCTRGEIPPVPVGYNIKPVF